MEEAHAPGTACRWLRRRSVAIAQCPADRQQQQRAPHPRLRFYDHHAVANLTAVPIYKCQHALELLLPPDHLRAGAIPAACVSSALHLLNCEHRDLCRLALQKHATLLLKLHHSSGHDTNDL